MADMEIRKARVQDLQEIYEVMKDTGYSGYFGNKEFSIIQGKLLSFLFGEGVTTLVAITDEKVIGYSIFDSYAKYYVKKKLPEQVEINDIILDLRKFAYCLGFGVHSKNRKKGLGTALLLDTNYEAKKQGYQGMVTDVDSGNTSSLKVQEKLKFFQVMRFSEKKRPSGINTVWVKVF